MMFAEAKAVALKDLIVNGSLALRQAITAINAKIFAYVLSVNNTSISIVINMNSQGDLLVQKINYLCDKHGLKMDLYTLESEAYLILINELNDSFWIELKSVIE